MLRNIPTTNAGLLRRLSSIILILLISAFLVRAQQPPSGAKSAFTAKLMNIEAASNEIFRYTTTLHNGSASAKVYELKPDLPAGWMIAFKIDGTQVTSLNLDAGKSQDITVEINA